jgi:ferric-dicitrate binding protein FerR (iron transport regulator)
VKADKSNMDIDELLVKYLADEAGADERAQAEAWMAASAANKAYFEHFKLLWDESLKLAHASPVDEDVAWERFRERIHREYVGDTKPKRNYLWLKVAAVILLASAAVLVGPYFFRHNNEGGRFISTTDTHPPVRLVKSATADKVQTDTLPDGSTITLNKYSGISYPAGFKGSIRTVQLNGEAFFNVKHDESKPFVVKVNDLLVTVLGTSFNIKSAGDKTEVIVESGVVGVTKQSKSVMLYPGEKLTTLETDMALKKELNKDTAYRAYVYKQHAYTFKYTLKGKGDTTFDINKHPDLLKQILNDPGKWASLLKRYGPKSENLEVRKTVIRSVLDELANENIAARGTVNSFRLNDGEFIINNRRQPETVHQRFKDMFIKEPGYSIYLGDAPRNGKGIFLSRDSL